MQLRAGDCAALLHEHQGLIENNVVDFITKDLWTSQVPPEWRDVLAKLTTEQLLALPTTLSIEPDWPPSLRRFLKNARDLSLPARPEEASRSTEVEAEQDKA